MPKIKKDCSKCIHCIGIGPYHCDANNNDLINFKTSPIWCPDFTKKKKGP